jgi:hypothetical protein
VSGKTSPRDYFMPLRDLALRLQSDALVLDQQARDLKIKAAELRQEADVVYGAWSRLANVRPDNPIVRDLHQIGDQLREG